MMTLDKTAIRNAATIIVVRDRFDTPKVLMGQRGSKAAFMPNKFVFPGGAVDQNDAHVPLANPISESCTAKLLKDCDEDLTHALCVAAIRELFEETGLILGQDGNWPSPIHSDWVRFAASGRLPDASALQFVFRAITPPGRPRRFDARFFLLDADQIGSDLDDFSAASDELSHLQWIPVEDVRKFDLPFITEVVLAEVIRRLHDTTAPTSIPFYRNSDEESLFLRIYGDSRTMD